MKPSHQEYAELVAQSYKSHGGNPQEPWKTLHTVAYKGFTATAYINDETKQVVIAVPGTDPQRPQTFEEDLDLIKKNVPHFEKFLMDFTEDIRLQLLEEGLLPQYQLSYSGHSLGAALAQLAALRTGLSTVVFESPGVKDITDKYPNRYVVKPNQITIINTTPNVVTSLNQQLVEPNYIKVSTPQSLGYPVSKLLFSAITLGLQAFLPQAILAPINNLSATQKKMLQKCALAIFSLLANWTINGLLKLDNPISSSLRIANVSNQLLHYHSIDNIVNAYQQSNGTPETLNINQQEVGLINQAIQHILGETRNFKLDIACLDYLTKLLDSTASTKDLDSALLEDKPLAKQISARAA